MLNVNKIKALAVVLALTCTANAWSAGKQGGGSSHGGGGRSSGGASHVGPQGSFGGNRSNFGSSHQGSQQGTFQRGSHSNFQSSRPSFNTNNTTKRNDIYDYTHRQPTNARPMSSKPTSMRPTSPAQTNQGQANRNFKPDRSFQDRGHVQGFDNQRGHQQTQGSNPHQFGSTNRPTTSFHYAPNQSFHNAPNRTQFTRSGNRFEMRRPDGSRTIRSRNGIIHERPFERNHTTYVRRTYIRDNYVSVRHYTVSYWGHRPFYCYTPYRVYPAPFYGWVWRPWGPVSYSWGWYDEPWYGYYGYYWHPYPVYYGPSFWLTDFVISDILAAAYAEDRAENNARAQAAANAAIDDKIKAQVREEVEAELKARKHQQSVPMDRAVSSGYVHVVTKDMDVAVASSNESCALSSGDIVKISKTPSKDDEVVAMTVVTSKRGGCRPNTHVLMSLDDLQDMKNHFSESIDKGLEKLQEQQGKGGLPAAPQDAQAAPQETLTPAEKAAAVQEAKEAAQEMQSQDPAENQSAAPQSY